MANPHADVVRDYLVRVTGSTAPADDDSLLTRFFVRHDADAFAALLHRHGPMVMGIARRILGGAGEADAAFQSTFLVLARKGQAVRRGGPLASWLHRVARRVAVRALTQRIPTGLAGHPTEAVDPTWREVMGALDDEIDRLPDRYRAPLILCYLEGLTRDEAATRLRWSLPTVRRRVERGRELLKVGLASRGVSPLVLGATVLGLERLREAVSASLYRATMLMVLGKSVPPAIAALADGLAVGSRFKFVVVAVTATILAVVAAVAFCQP